MALQDNKTSNLQNAKWSAKLTTEAATHWRKIFDVKSMSFSTTPRQEAQDVSLASGTSTVTGPPGPTSATMTVGVNDESGGQQVIQKAFAEEGRLNLRRQELVGVEQVQSADLASDATVAISAATADGAGARVTLTGLDDIKNAAVQGMFLIISDSDGSNLVRYFIEEVQVDAAGAIDEIIVAIGSSDDFAWNGVALAAKQAGKISLNKGRTKSTIYTATPTTPIFPEDAASEQPTNVTAQIQFSIEGRGVTTYTDPS